MSEWLSLSRKIIQFYSDAERFCPLFENAFLDGIKSEIHHQENGIMLRRFVLNYIERHRHPMNQVLHIIGVPLTFVVSIIFLIQGESLWALASFLGGYFLQFAGHVIEGNDAGEVVLFKRMRGKSYNEFGPLSKQSDSYDHSADT